MRPAEFAQFAERTLARYAHENVASFRWDEDNALAHARELFNQLLPQGLDTPDNYLCEILDDAAGKAIGELWFAVPSSPTPRSAYLYDLHIAKAHRREHHADAALRQAEARCRELGATSLGLQVFAHNSIAQALYNSFGYSVASFNMVKRLDGA